MNTEAQDRRQAIIKEIYVGIIGWVWIALAIATVYFLVRAIFYGGTWWYFLGCAVLCRLFYGVALYYQLEKERTLRVAAEHRDKAG